MKKKDKKNNMFDEETKKLDSLHEKTKDIDETDEKAIITTTKITKIDNCLEEDYEGIKNQKNITDEENTKVFDKSLDDECQKKENLDHKKKTSNKNKYVIIILIILILILLLIIIYVIQERRISNKPQINDEITLTEEEKKEIVIKHGVEIEEKIKGLDQNALKEIDIDKITQNISTKNVKCENYWINEDKTVYISDCSINGIKTEYTYGKRKEIISKESTINIYKSKRNNKVTLIKPEALSLYDVFSIKCEDVCKNPEILNKSSYIYYYDKDNNINIYNYKTGNKVFNSIPYQELYLIKHDDKTIDKNYVSLRLNNYIGIYNLINENPIISPMYNDFLNKDEKNKIINVYNENLIAKNSDNYGMINFKTNEMVIPFEYNSLTKKDQKIVGKKANGNMYEFDLIGNIIKTIPNDITFTTINEKYKISRLNGNIVLLDENNKELYNYGQLDVEKLNYFNMIEREDEEKLFIQFFTENAECVNLTFDFKSGEGKITEDECNMH